MSEFFCGAARRIITPPVGTLLYGYEPDIISTSVHDDLTATAVAVGNGETDGTALLISLTLGDLQTALCGVMREEAAKAGGILTQNVIVASTHAHSGPNVSGLPGWGEIDPEYIDGILLPAIREASAEAVARMVPAEMSVNEGRSDVGVNRRQRYPDGLIGFGQNPWGLYDPAMTLITFRDKATKAGILHFIHYGCHGTAAGMNHEITRDWSGVMIDRMEKQTGVMTVYFNGALGDVGPRLSSGKTSGKGDIRYAEELGAAAALDAIRISRDKKTFISPEVMLYHGEVALPTKPFPTLEKLRDELAAFEDPETLTNIEALEYAHRKDVEAELLAGRCDVPPHFTYDQTIIRMGDVVLIPCPFEPFAEVVLRLREYSPYAHTLMISCANGYDGYLPTQHELVLGGYEVAVFRTARLYELADDADQQTICQNLDLLLGKGWYDGRKADDDD